MDGLAPSAAWQLPIAGLCSFSHTFHPGLCIPPGAIGIASDRAGTLWPVAVDDALPERMAADSNRLHAEGIFSCFAGRSVALQVRDKAAIALLLAANPLIFRVPRQKRCGRHDRQLHELLPIETVLLEDFPPFTAPSDRNTIAKAA